MSGHNRWPPKFKNKDRELQRLEARVKELEKAGGLTKESLLIDRKNAEASRDLHIKQTGPLRKRVAKLERLLIRVQMQLCNPKTDAGVTDDLLQEIAEAVA